MDTDELRKIRTEAIANMYTQLEEVEHVNLPHWVLMTVMLPMFMGMALHMSLRMAWAFIKAWCLTPFSFIAIWADLLGIIWWFFRTAVKRMGRK